MTFRTFAAWLMLAGTLAGCRNTNEPEPRPDTIYACETNTAPVCGFWTLEGGVYNAEWPQGSRAVIRVDRFDADSVVFRREDTPLSTSAGMTAVYRGRVQGRSVMNGVVTWTHNGFTFSGRFNANW